MTEGTQPRLRVIVADDEPDVRLLLRLQLAQVGDIDQIGEAADGSVALDLCRELEPDAVVMDLLMPRVSGIDAIETLRAEFPRIGVVAYSATAGEHVRLEMQRLGVVVLLKSGDVNQLVDALWASVRASSPP